MVYIILCQNLIEILLEKLKILLLSSKCYFDVPLLSIIPKTLTFVNDLCGRMTYFTNLDFLIQVSVVLLLSMKNDRMKKNIFKKAEFNYNLILYSYSIWIWKKVPLNSLKLYFDKTSMTVLEKFFSTMQELCIFLWLITIFQFVVAL